MIKEENLCSDLTAENLDDDADNNHEEAENLFGGQKIRWIYGMRRRMRELLALPAPECGERDYLTGLGVPPEKIDNCMMLIGVLFRLSVEGNMRAFQELRNIIGDNETELDRRMKVAQLNKTKVQTEDIRRKISENEEVSGDGANTLAEALEESTASLWQNGGDI